MPKGLPVLLLATLVACAQVPGHGQSQGTSGATAAGASTGTGSTGGTAGNTGTSGGTTTGGLDQDGGDCSLDRMSAQGDDCIPSFPCGCPLICLSDPLEALIYLRTGSYVCEAPCARNSDCPSIGTACVDGGCAAIPCGAGDGNGLFNSLCAMGAVPDSGTCAPLDLQLEGVDAGMCLQGGSARTSCDPYADRSQLAEVCVAGLRCDPLSGDAGECRQHCDTDDGCPTWEFCDVPSETPTDGVCIDAGVP